MVLKNITFVHPTTGATLCAELEDWLTVDQVIAALVEENFIAKPDDSCRYIFGIVGIGKREGNDTFIGVPDNSIVNIIEPCFAGGESYNSNSRKESILTPVEFSVIVPENINERESKIINLLVYEDYCKDIVEKTLLNNKTYKALPMGRSQLAIDSKVTVVLSSEEIEIENNIKTHIWMGGYLRYTFPVRLLEKCRKQRINVSAMIYIDDVITAQLDFFLPVDNDKSQVVPINRKDIMSAFMSYASQDRNKVISIMQGMKKVRPEMDIFFDVDSLRSGENWNFHCRKKLITEIICFYVGHHLPESHIGLIKNGDMRIRVKVIRQLNLFR